MGIISLVLALSISLIIRDLSFWLELKIILLLELDSFICGY